MPSGTSNKGRASDTPGVSNRSLWSQPSQEGDPISIEFAIEIRKVIVTQDGVRTDPESALSPEALADSGIFLRLGGRE